MWHQHPDQHSCIEALAAHVAGQIRTRLQAADTFTLCVSGGRSPIPLFERLADSPIDWPRVRVRLVDERYVPPEHPDSNEGLLRRHLLKGCAGAADFRGLYLPQAGLEAAVHAANADAQSIDLAILGMGDDGHTASLFSDAPQFEAATAPDAACYLHVTPPHAAHERITLSLAALKACGALLMYISGTTKRRILREAEKRICKRLPVSLLAADPGVFLDVHWHP